MVADELQSRGETFLTGLLRPWNAYQIGIAIGLYGIAWFLARLITPRARAWLSEREDWPLWRVKTVLVVLRRLRGIFFVILLWAVFHTMQELTWPSRSYLLGIIGTLVLAWLAVVFVTRLIRNRFLRQVVTYGAWIYVTLQIAGILPEVTRALDSLSVSIGEFQLSILLVIQMLVWIGVLITLARFITRATAERIERSDEMSPSMRVFTVKALQIALYSIAVVVGLNVVGVDLTGLAVLSGAIGVGLGFGLQKVVSNLVSGLIILLDKSIKPGDVISLGETFGWIQTLGARYASVVTRDGKEYLIPNEDLITNQVVNWSHSDKFVRLDLYFGTSYSCDPHKVRRLAIEAAAKVDRVLPHRPPVCHIVGFGDSSVDYVLRFWITDPAGGLMNIRGNVYLSIWDAFKENNISIPFPQREVRMLGDQLPDGEASSKSPG